ncbi:MAG: hypothetical protein MJZ22_00455 [Candidatus Saccharibacteria bacterium]|nr:hypothetical protein [Candidatus Saccharibacteria bacterium]
MGRYILFDNQENYDFLISDFDKAFYSPKCQNKIISWITGAFNVLIHSKRKDTIVCWFDFQAIIVYYLSFLFGKRKIVCINLLLKPKSSIKNTIVTILYKRALSSKYFHATVTAPKYGDLLNKKFGKIFHYTLLRDVYHSYYENATVCHQTISKSIFCGGRNGRDWEFLLNLAEKMIDYSFYFVVPAEIYDRHKSNIPQNVHFSVDVPYNIFMDIMLQSQIVLMPLDTEAPAGLIVLFQTIANQKPFIVSRTATTESYIFNNEDFFIPNDLSKWEEKIHEITECYDIYCEKVLKLRASLEKNCNEMVFKKKIQDLINEKNY